MNLLSHIAQLSSAKARAKASASLRAGSVHLVKDQMLRIPGGAGWSLQAVRGSIWITRDGDLDDHFLEAGETYVFDRPGIGLLSSLSDSDICLANSYAQQAACNAGTIKQGAAHTEGRALAGAPSRTGVGANASTARTGVPSRHAAPAFGGSSTAAA